MTRQDKINPASPLGRAGAVPPAVPATLHGDPENFLELGYGTGPRCIMCRRNVSGCHCDEVEAEPEYFRPAINCDPDNYVDRIPPLPSDWSRIVL